MSPRMMLKKFVSFMYLDHEQLVDAVLYIDNMLQRDYSVEFEYYYDLKMYANKCFNVLKKQKNCRIGLTVCKGEIVDLICDPGKHEFCSCSKVLFKTNLKDKKIDEL